MVGDIILIAPAKANVVCHSAGRNNHRPHRLLASPNSVTRQGSAVGAASARLLLSRGYPVSRRNPASDHSKDIDVPMPMLVHYRVALSASSITAGEGRLLDLSAEGCRVETQQELPVNTYLSMRLIVSPNEMPILVDLAAVRWSRGTVCGIQFLSLLPLQTARLKTFLDSASPKLPPTTPDKA
ncbi:MAG: hypothetical protein GDA66_05140 [Nitrospira sp. CR1.2]|nr:hypothetical protein [Nitrospira sp. CR1.2]